MEIKRFVSEVFHSNTYVVYDKGEAMVIDCGAICDAACAFIRKTALHVKYIVLTHGHCDHVDFIDDYVRAFPEAELICHEDEVKVLHDPEANVSRLFGLERTYCYPYKTVRAGDAAIIGDYSFSVLHTPGHTPGGICLYCAKAGVIFTGDTMFRGTYGRTDFKYGSRSELISSLKMLLSLEPSTVVYSGHDEKTTIGEERNGY